VLFDNRSSKIPEEYVFGKGKFSFFLRAGALPSSGTKGKMSKSFPLDFEIVVIYNSFKRKI